MRDEKWMFEGNPYNRSWFQDKYFKTKEQKMRNIIKILDKDVQKPNISNIEVGSMFRYPKSNDGYVYMKITPQFFGDISVVLLSTGAFYSDFDRIKEVEVVTTIQISR